MCGILFTNKDIEKYDLNDVLFFLRKRGPDKTNVEHFNNFTFIHTLLSMTGPLTVQPFYDINKDVICMFNGEIYNFQEFGHYSSDGECLIPLYKKYGTDFIHKLDGEFAIVLLDLKENKLIFSTDIFSTRPLWIAFDDQKHVGISTYKSCLDRIDLTNNFQILANKTYVLDINNMKIIQEKRVHTFDLKQYKNNLHDWNKAFSNSIKKRTQYAKCGIFIGMSGGYDSGAIACELHKQNIEFSAYSICNVEDKQVMKERSNIIKNSNLIELERDDFLQARSFLKKNAEEYLLNIDNGETEKYLELITKPNYSKSRANTLLRTIDFRKKGQILTDDNGAIGCSYICSLAKNKNEKIYLSGSGADEIFSDYGFKGIKYFDHSTIGGHFPNNLSDVFPWKNFFRNTQRSYLMKEEHVAGSYGIEGRYPFLDKYVVQEFLWLLPELKNKEYKYPLDQYLTMNNFPYEKEQKTGFGCGFAGPNPNGIHFQTLTKEQKQHSRNRKVTDYVQNRKVDFNKLMLKNTRSYEDFYIIKKENIRHEIGNCYYVQINLNLPGLKYYDKSRFTVLENNEPLRDPVTRHDLIRHHGKGNFCFWTSNTLYFSTSDNSDPRTNNKTYSIIKFHNNLTNNFDNKEYYIKIEIENCKYNTSEYFKIRQIFNMYNSIPNILACENHEIFMDLPNIKFCRYQNRNNYKSKIIINNLDIDIDAIKFLLNSNNRTICKDINQEQKFTLSGYNDTKKVIIFYHLKDWYNLSYPVLFNYLGIKKNKDMFRKNDIELIDFKNFLSKDDKQLIDISNKNNKDIDYISYVKKAVSNLVDIMRNNNTYDNSILIGFQNIGSDCFFYRKGHCPFDYYDIFKSKKCKFIMWMDDLHGFPNFPKIEDFDENKDYSKCCDYRLDLVDKILTPSRHYYELLNSQYLDKTIQYFYSLNEDWYSEININNFQNRENKILLSGSTSVYPIRNLLREIVTIYNPKVVTSSIYNPSTFPQETIDKIKNNIKDYNKKFSNLIDALISPGYNRNHKDFFNKVGINYLKTIAKYKGVFFGYGKKPLNFNLAKIIEILMCGSIGFFEFSPLLEKELGLIAFKHYVPITDGEGKLIGDVNYYLKYLNSKEGEQIALNGANYVRKEFTSNRRINQLISILKDMYI